MGVKDRRRLNKTGRYSYALTIPASLEKGEVATLAANRLLLADPRGEIPEEDLLEFLETVIEPRLWQWLENKRIVRKNACRHEDEK